MSLLYVFVFGVYTVEYSLPFDGFVSGQFVRINFFLKANSIKKIISYRAHCVCFMVLCNVKDSLYISLVLLILFS